MFSFFLVWEDIIPSLKLRLSLLKSLEDEIFIFGAWPIFMEQTVS